MSEERVVSDLVWTPERGGETPEVRGISWENFLLSDDKYLGKWKTDSGIRITPETALQSTVVLACCRILAETVSGLPIHVYRRDSDGGDDIAKEIPLYKVLTFRPNDWQTKQEFFEQMMMNLTLWGNSYTRIRSGQYGSVSQLDNLHPSRMDVERLENGRLRYSYTDPETGRLERYTQDQIMHVRWTPEQDGIKGMVPVEIAREAIGLARACEQHAARFWANSARPGVVLQTEGTLNAEAAERLRDNWERLHRGSERAFRTAVLTGGMKAVELGMTNESSQFQASRAHQTEEIARVYRCPLHLIQGTPGGDLEVQGQEFVTYTLMPWLNRIESSISRSLIYNDDEYYAKFDVRGLLRANSQQRASYYSTMTSLGIMTINDCRRAEGLKPLGSLGDHHFVAMNTQTLEEATKPKPEAPAGGMPGMPGGGGGGDGPPPPVPGGPPSLPEVKTGKAPTESPKGEASTPKSDPQPQMEEAIEEASADWEEAVEDRAFCATGSGGGIDNSCGANVMAGPDKDSGGGVATKSAKESKFPVADSMPQSVSVEQANESMQEYVEFRPSVGTNNSVFAVPPSEEDLTRAILISNKDKVSKIGKARELPDGTPVAIRIDIPAFNESTKQMGKSVYAVTVHESKGGKGFGSPIGYETMARLSGSIVFASKETEAIRVATGESTKTPLATVKGAFDASREIPKDIDSWTPVGFDPKKAAYFYDKRTGREVVGGIDSLSVGNTVFTRIAEYGPRNAKTHYRSTDEMFATGSWGLESRAFCATGEGGGIDNSCGAGTAAVVREVLKSIEKTGGFSVHPVSAKSPKTGFMCATVPHAEKIFQSSEEITETAVQSYLDQHGDFLSENPKLHLGGWIDPDTEKVYLDLSEQFEDEASAVAAGIKHNQLAVWDVANKREVRIRRDDNGQRSQAADSVRLSSGVGSEGDCGSVEQSTRGVEGTEESRDCDTGIESQVDSRAFCPTGEGQGVDNSCGSGSGAAPSSVDNSWKKAGREYSFTPGEGKSPIVGGEDIKSLSIESPKDVSAAMKDLKVKSLTDVVTIGGGLTRGAFTSVVANGEEIHVMSEVPIDPDNEESGSMSSTISLGVDPEGKKYIDCGTMHASTDEGTANLTGEDAARMSSILLEKFPESLAAAEKSGFDYAQTFAMGSSEDEFKGYRLWPQFGFDAEIYSDIRENIPKDVVPHDDPVTIQELISTPAGKKWWNANGESMAMTLSFKDKKSAGYKRFKDAIKLAERLKKRNEGRSLYDYLMGEGRGFCATGPGGGIDNSCGVNMAPDRDMGSSVAAPSAGAGKPASVTVESQGNLDKATAALGVSSVDDVVTLGGGNVRGAKVDVYGDESGFVKVSSMWPIDREDPRGGGKVFTEVSMANTPEGKVLGFEAFGPTEGSVASGASQQKVMSIISEKVAESIDSAENHGFVAVTTFAVGDANNQYKGYRLWPQFGFDADLPRDLSKRVPPEIVLKSKGIEIPPAGSTSIPQHLVIKSLASQHRDLTIQELISTREGDRWWDENGDDIELKLDLTDKSSLGYRKWQGMKDRLPRLRERNETRSFFDAFVEERGFCPTGEGGGIDNSCGNSDGGPTDAFGGSIGGFARTGAAVGGKAPVEQIQRAPGTPVANPVHDAVLSPPTTRSQDGKTIENTSVASRDVPGDIYSFGGREYVSTVTVGQHFSEKQAEDRGGVVIDTSRPLSGDNRQYVVDAHVQQVQSAMSRGIVPVFYTPEERQKQIEEYSVIEPKILGGRTKDGVEVTPENAEFVFRAVQAVTSSNASPEANMKRTQAVLDKFFNGDGRVATSTAFGVTGQAIIKSLSRLQTIVDRLGLDQTRELFVDKTMRSGDIDKFFRDVRGVPGDKNAWKPSSYLVDQEVPVFSVFGPKFGTFFANNTGQVGHLTADIWATRTFGRVTGELIQEAKPDKARSYSKDVAKLIRSASADMLHGYDGDQLFDSLKQVASTGEMTDMVRGWAGERLRNYARGDFTEKRGVGGKLNKLAKNMVENDVGLMGTPGSGKRRANMIDVYAEVSKKTGIPVAYAQDVLWQDEQDAYAAAGAKTVTAVGELSFYSDVIRKIARDPEGRFPRAKKERRSVDSEVDGYFDDYERGGMENMLWWEATNNLSDDEFADRVIEMLKPGSKEDRSALESARDAVVELRSAGLTTIVMQNAGREGLHVMGFDADIPKDIAETLPETLSHCKTLLDLHVSSEGRSWWEQNGRDIDVAIDLEGVQGQVFDGFATGKTFSDIIEEGILDDYGNS